MRGFGEGVFFLSGLCNYIMNQMDKQNRIDGLRDAVESSDLEQAIGDVLGTICEFGARCAREFFTFYILNPKSEIKPRICVARMRLFLEHCFDAAFVLFLGADGDADVFREAVGGHGAEDDALGETFVEAIQAVADFDKDEVGVAGDVGDAAGLELLLEELAAGTIEGDGALKVVGVVQGGGGGGLGDGRDVEGGAGAVEVRGNPGGGDGVPDAESGESVYLGEGAGNDDVLALFQVFEGVRLVVCVLDVGLIEDNDDVVRDGCHEVVQLLLVDHGAERIGGVGDVDEPRLRGDGAEGGLEVGREVRFVGDGDVSSVDGLGKDFVEGEAVVSGDGVGAGAEEDEAEEEKELTAARNGDDLFHGDIMEGGDALSAGEGGTVRVEV